MSDNYEEFDDFDFDDFGDTGDGGFQPDGSNKTKARSPVVKFGGAVVTGVKDGILDPANQVKFLQQVLPEGYVAAIDVADKTLTGAKEIYEEGLAGAKEVRKQVRKGVKTFMPVLNPILPKALSERLTAWGKEEEEHRGDTPVDPEAAEIAMTLGTIFSKHQEAQRARDEEEGAKQEVRESIGIKQNVSSLSALLKLNNTVGKLVSYQEQVTANYQHKSLELQYRHYFATRKLLDVTQQAFEASKIANIDLIKNTGLPDMVKQQNVEKALDLLKTNTYGRVTDSMSSWFRGTGDRIVGRAKSNLKGFFKDLGANISEGVMMGDMGISSMQSAREMAELQGPNGARDMGIDMAGGQAGGMLARWLGQKLVKPVRDRVMANETMGGTSNMLLRGITDAPALLNEYAGSYSNRGGLAGMFENFIKSSVGTTHRNDTVMTGDASTLEKNAVWNNQSQRTLNEIIPAWLSKMTAELKGIRTGKTKDGEIERESYNFETNRFEGAKETTKNLKEKVFNPYNMKKINRDIENTINILDPLVKLSEPARAALRELVWQKANDRKPFSYSSLVSDANFPSSLSKWKAEIMPMAKERFGFDTAAEVDDQGNFKSKFGPFKIKGEGQENLTKFSMMFSRLQNSIPDVLSSAVGGAKAGHQELMEKAGILERDGNSYKLNNKSLYDQIRSSAAGDAPVPVFGPPAPPSGGAPGAAPGPAGAPGAPGAPAGLANGGMFNGRGGINRAAGDLVEGEGTGKSDSINANLSNREFVVNNKATSLPGMLPLLRYLNGLGLSGGTGTTGDITHEPGVTKESAVENAIDRLHDTFKSQLEEVTYILADTNSLISDISKKSLMGVNLGELLKGVQLPNMGAVGDRARAHLSSGEQALLGIKDAISPVISGAWGAATGTASVIGKTSAAASRGIKGAIGGAWEMGKDYIKERGEKAKLAALDIYVKGMEKAKLTAYGIQNGLYIDQLTGRVINSIEDITGPVVDKSNNVIISAEEWAKGVHRYDFKPLLENITDKMKSLANKMTRPFTTVSGLVGKAKSMALDILDAPEDIYIVPDLTTPRLYARVFEMGGYRLKEGGAVITRFGQINGAVIDAEGKVLLTVEELGKMVNKDGKPLKGLKGKARDLFKKALKKGLEMGSAVLDTVKAKALAVKDKIKGAFNKVGEWKDSAMDLIKGGGTKLSGAGAVLSGKAKEMMAFHKPVVDKLIDIYDLLNHRLPGTGTGKKKKGKKSADGSSETPEASNEELMGPPEATRLQRLKGSISDRLTGLRTGVTGKIDALKGKFAGLGLPSMPSLPTLGGLGAKAAKAKEDALAKATSIKESAVAKSKELKDKAAAKSKELKDKAALKITTAREATAAKAKEWKDKATADLTARKAATAEKFKAGRESAAAKLKAWKDKAVSLKAKLTGSPLDADGDGDRDGSAKDQQEKRDKAAAAGEERSKWSKLTDGLKGLGGRGGKAVGAGVSGLMGLLAMIPGIGTLAVGVTKVVGAVVSAGTGLVNLVKSMVGMGPKIMGFLSKAKAFMTTGFGGKVLRTGANVVRGVFGALRSGAVRAAGMAVASTVGLPVLAGVAIGAAIAYGSYKAYKYFSSAASPLARFRLFQYGFNPTDDEEKVGKIAALEALCIKHVKVSPDGPAELGTGVKVSEALAIFGVKIDDKKELDKWVNWFTYRFKRVFLAHVTLHYKMSQKTDITKADETLKKADKLVYLKKVHFGNTGADSPYKMMASPFSGDETVPVDEDGVKSAYSDALDKVKAGADDNTKKDAAKSEKDLKAKDEGKSWWDSAKEGGSNLLKGAMSTAAAAWGGIKSVGAGIASGAANVGGAIAGGVKAAGAGLAAAGGAVASGVGSVYNTAVDATSSGIESVANVLKGSKKDNFEAVRKAAAKAGDPHPAVVAAQWALESGWGKHQSGKFNFFGVKARGNEPATMRRTREVLKGKEVYINAPFRDYSSLEDGIAGRVAFINKNPRYRKAGYHDAKTPFEGATALRRAGYATDPNYAPMLAKIMAGAGINPDKPEGTGNPAASAKTLAVTLSGDGKMTTAADSFSPKAKAAAVANKDAAAKTGATTTAGAKPGVAVKPAAASTAQAAPTKTVDAVVMPAVDVMAVSNTKQVAATNALASAQQAKATTTSNESMTEVANILRNQLTVQSRMDTSLNTMNTTFLRVEKLLASQAGGQAAAPRMASNTNANPPAVGRPITPPNPPVSMSKA